MAFTWRDFLRLARALATGRTNVRYSREAAKRTAVSRAYYAAFCHVLDWCEKKDPEFKRTGTVDDHSLLPQYLSSQGLIDVADDLQQLRDWRNRCDYEASIADLDQLVELALKMAKRILRKCR